MVDRISKINPDHTRVDASRDATDEEGRRQPEDDGEETDGQGEGDAFDRLRDRTDWSILIDQPRTNQKRVDVLVEDIEALKFLHINLKTNPSLLNVEVKLKDGGRFPSAYFSIPRHMALTFQHARYGSRVDPADLTEAKTIPFFVPDVREADEVTRVTAVEKTFSQTVKMLMRKTLLQKIGVQDPDTKSANPEVVWAYVTAAIVALSLVFAVWWMMR